MSEKMSLDRLSSTEWVNAGLRALARSGFTALKADTLAKTLGVSRGSFYWHFADVSAFRAAVLARWREVALDTIVAELEGTAGDRLVALIKRAFSTKSNLENAIRAWAFADGEARAAVDAVDAERERYLEKLVIEAGADPASAQMRARILNWAYLGYSLSSVRLDADELAACIDDLLALARRREEV
jgi:AcrR family transcriptional regulator